MGHRGRHATVAIALLATACAACSVSTPRDGFTVSAGPGGVGPAENGPGPYSPVGEDAALSDPATGASGGRSAQGAPTAGGGQGATENIAETGASAPVRAGAGAEPGAGAGPGAGATSSPDGSPGNTDPGASTGGATAVGVTDTTVTISVIGSFSGAVGAIVSAVYEAGFGTWLDDVNANGGIHGRKVVVKKIDDKATPEGGVAACKEAQANGSLMTFVFRSTDDSAADCLDAARVPVFATVVTELKPWSHLRSLFLLSHRGVLVARYVKGGLGDGKKKLGVLYVNTAATEVSKDGYVAEAKRLGMNVVQVEAVQTNQASFTSELLRLKNAGAENVAMFVNTESIGVLRDAKALGYQPRFTGVSWCVDEFSTAAGGLYEGIKCLRSFTTTETPAYKAYREKANKYGRGGTATSTAMWAYGMGLVTGRVLEAAGPTPTRESVAAGYNSITGYDTDIVPTASWSPDRIIGSYAEIPVVCCNPDNTWKMAGAASDQF